MHWVPMNQKPDYKTLTSTTSTWQLIWHHCPGFHWPTTRGEWKGHHPDHDRPPQCWHMHHWYSLLIYHCPSCCCALQWMVLWKWPHATPHLWQRCTLHCQPLDCTPQAHQHETKNVNILSPWNWQQQWTDKQTCEPSYLVPCQQQPEEMASHILQCTVHHHEHDECIHWLLWFPTQNQLISTHYPPYCAPHQKWNSKADHHIWHHYMCPPRCSGSTGQPPHCQNLPGIPCQQTPGTRGYLWGWQPHHALHWKLLLQLQTQRQNMSYQIHATTQWPLHGHTHLPWMLRIHPQTSQQPQHLPQLSCIPTKMIYT